MYASTKAFMTMFATSLAAEVRSLGVDVVVVHPSPMATNFFDNAGTITPRAVIIFLMSLMPWCWMLGSLGTLLAFKKLAAGPSVIGA